MVYEEIRDCRRVSGSSLLDVNIPTVCVDARRPVINVRHYLPRHALLTLIRALVVSKVDYCNSVLAGVSAHLLDRLACSQF